MKAIPLISLLLLLELPQTLSVQQPQGAASLEGFVVKLGTTEPVTRAGVVLAPAATQGAASLAATTDGGGKFTFPNVSPGTYRLFAARDGFVRAEYGQRSAGRTGIPITIGLGQEIKDVLVSMTPTGAIAGHVYDRYGEPVGNATVRAMKFLYADGQRTLGEFQTTRTNDLGDYRLYWLEPGQYVVNVVPPQAVRSEGGFVVIEGGPGSAIRLNGGIPPDSIRVNGNVATSLGYSTPRDAAEACLPVYFPGTTDPAMASPIDLLPGVNFTGVDVTVAETRAANIRGQAVNGLTGETLGLQVSLVSRRGNEVAAPSRTSATGVGRPFEFRCVAPGAYDLVAMFNDQPVSVRVGGSGGQIVRTESSNNPQRRFYARVPIEVGGADIENITLVLQPGFSVTGRLAVEGTAAGPGTPGLAGMRVELRPEAAGPQSLFPGVVAADGTFTVSNLGPGEYRLRVISNAFKGFVKTARLAGIDVLNLNFRMESAPSGQLEIVLSPNGGTLNVAVADERQQPAANVTVALVPDAPRRQAFELYRNALTDASGRLHLDSIPPGDYKVFAWEHVEFSAWQYPDFIRRFEALGTPVSIREGAIDNVVSTLITAR